MKIKQQPTKSTPAQQRRWRTGVATGKGSRGEAQIDHLGAIELGSISNWYRTDVFTKKNISLPDHRVNKKSRTPPSDNLLRRGYLEGIGWLPMVMLLGPANGSTMVRHVLDVTFQPMARQLYLFIPVVICNLIEEPAKKHSDEPAKTIQHCNRWPDDCTFFPVVIWSRNLPKQSKLMEPPNIPTNGQTTVPFFPVIIWSTKEPAEKHSS